LHAETGGKYIEKLKFIIMFYLVVFVGYFPPKE
jgi:hypothetical protein